MCNCVNVQMGSYSNQTNLINPFNKKIVGIDSCLVGEVMKLWSLGIQTIESCCGHNTVEGYIAVDEHHIESMKMIGYIQINTGTVFDRKENIFKPKSIK